MYFIFVVILAEETPKSPGGTGNVSTMTTDAIIDITVLILGVVVIAVIVIFMIYRKRKHNPQRTNNYDGAMNNPVYDTISDNIRREMQPSTEYTTIHSEPNRSESHLYVRPSPYDNCFW